MEAVKVSKVLFSIIIIIYYIILLLYLLYNTIILLLLSLLLVFVKESNILDSEARLLWKQNVF